MRILKLTALSVALLLLPMLGSAQANHYSDFYVIPAAAHITGANNTLFMTDIAIQNFGTSPITIDLLFVEAGENNPDNVFPIFPAGSTGSIGFTVPAGGNLLISDVLKNFRGTSDVRGAILVGSGDGRPFAVTSRTYSLTATGGSLGVTVPPVRDFLNDAFGTTNNAMAVAYVPGLIVNSQYRTNLGLVAANLGSAPLVIEVALNDANGPILNAKRTFTVLGGNFEQVQFSTTLLTSANFNVGSATFRILSGTGSVVPYATVIDNLTADAVYIDGVFPKNVTSALSAPNAFRILFDRFKDR